MGQWLRVWTALLEDLSSVSRTHVSNLTAIRNSCSGKFSPFSFLWCLHTTVHTRCAYTYTLTHTKKLKYNYMFTMVLNHLNQRAIGFGRLSLTQSGHLSRNSYCSTYLHAHMPSQSEPTGLYIKWEHTTFLSVWILARVQLSVSSVH